MVIDGLEDAKVIPVDHPRIRLSSCTVCKVVVALCVAHLQMLQPLSWMHRQAPCKEHYILEDYTGDFHIQTHIVAEMVCLAHRRDGVLVRSKLFPELVSKSQVDQLRS
ncbi:hypothetical protein HanIR_Chr09g0434011 [Helianthus annuus]|nr:hypothetical protein HanIR_Chr09g0434011 [Helianthus annuus]